MHGISFCLVNHTNAATFIKYRTTVSFLFVSGRGGAFWTVESIAVVCPLFVFVSVVSSRSLFVVVICAIVCVCVFFLFCFVISFFLVSLTLSWLPETQSSRHYVSDLHTLKSQLLDGAKFYACKPTGHSINLLFSFVVVCSPHPMTTTWD